jgi:two-component system sensor histidine kinase VicK
MSPQQATTSSWRIFRHPGALVAGVIALVVAATALRFLVHPWFGTRFPFLFFLPVILGAAWLWGVWAGTLALLLSVVGADLFIEPFLELSIPRGDQAFSMGVFLALGAFLIFAAEVARRARGESEIGKEMLDQALRTAKMGYWDWDVSSGRIRWSENLEAIHGLPAGSMGSSFQSLLDRIHPEDAPRLEEAINRAAREGTDFEVDYRIPRSDGGVEWVHGQGHSVLAHRRVVRVTALATNITARRDADEARRYLAAIVASSEDPIISKDLTGRILSWNAAAERLFGYRAEEVVGRSIELLMPPDRAEDYRGVIERIARGERVEHYETLRRRKDGTIVEVSLTVSPVRDETGRIVAASKIARDLTAWREMERERQRTRELLMGTLGHDLRNPLNTITASLFFLRRHAPDEVQHIVDRMTSSTERMTRMIGQLLDFTRARLGGGIPLEKTTGDLGAICNEIVEEFGVQYPNRVRLSAEGAFPGDWDADRLAQVFSNLIVNAIDYGSPDEPVEITMSRANGSARVAVRNRGEGIAEAERMSLFEPFRRGLEMKRGARGLGLGLYITREIVRSHGGAIDVETPPGEVVFTVTLPLQEAQPRSSSRLPAAPSNSARK